MMFAFLLEIATIPTEAVSSSSAVDFSFLFIKMISALVVACVLAVLILKYLVPKLSFAKKSADDQRIKILSRVLLSQKQCLYLVRVDKKCILLGATDQGINKLGDMEDEKV